MSSYRRWLQVQCNWQAEIIFHTHQSSSCIALEPFARIWLHHRFKQQGRNYILYQSAIAVLALLHSPPISSMIVRFQHPPNEVDQVTWVLEYWVAADGPLRKTSPPAHLLGHSVHNILSCDTEKVLSSVAVECHDAAERPDVGWEGVTRTSGNWSPHLLRWKKLH